MPSRSFGSSGSVTRLTTSGMVASLTGVSPLKASFRPAGSTTSLTSGLPSRDTCTGSPTAVAVPGASCKVRRSVSLQTPITGFACGSPFAVTSESGTCSTHVLTLVPDSVSWPTSDRSPP